jgi:integrase
MGLGSLRDRPLSEAREVAQACRKQLASGIDPIDARDSAVSEVKAKIQAEITFEKAALQCIETRKHEWSNPKHAAQWTSTLKTYAFPVIGDRVISAITVHDILAVLEPIWLFKTETAARVRQRLETVIDWAKARGHFHGENPARRDGPLGQLLPKASKVKRVEHFSALPFGRVAEFVNHLHNKQTTASLALEFLILTAARTGEVIGARWDELDLANALWIIPAKRMKAKREHRVPLSGRCLQILAKLSENKNVHGWIFPSPSDARRSLSNGAFLQLIKNMNDGAYAEYTPHGFRSAFRDWAAETTNYPPEVVEMALAHTIRNQVEAAYRRGDLLEKRRQLMEEWCGETST